MTQLTCIAARPKRARGNGVCAFAPLLATVAALVAALMFCSAAYAASGTVYKCTVVPSYAHPYTGDIEDSGGTSAQATGQAMAESCLSTKGMLEVTDGGKYYLTIRLGLIDYTRNQAFQVQEWGSSSWSDPKLGVTAEGSDSNGTTNDVCIQVPSQKCVVRISMFVESMGRDVVFYCYPKSFEKGTPSGFEATRVTTASKGGAAEKSTDKKTASSERKKANEKDASDKKANDAEKTSESAKNDAGKSDEPAKDSSADSGEASTDEPTANSADELAGSSVTSNAQGLSLSTAGETATGNVQQSGDSASAQEGAADQTTAPQAGLGVGESILVNVVSIAGSGLILMAAAAGIVYYFRRNWNRWGGNDPDDYSDLYRSDDE